jgi:hypothetical protein
LKHSISNKVFVFKGKKMRRHNKKGNDFYKVARTIPKYVSIDAVLVKVAQNYLRKIAEVRAEGTPDPNISNPTGSTKGTTDSLPKGTSAGPNAQNAQPSSAAQQAAVHKPENAPSESGGAPATGTVQSGPSVEKPPGSVGQGTTSQPAGESPTSGGAVSVQSGTIGTETKTKVTSETVGKTDVTSGTEKTDVVEAPSRKKKPNYLKNLALLVGIPLTIASLAGGAIRGFNMSSLIGLGLGAVATVYGFGFLDSILHPKAMLYEEFEKLKQREAGQFLSDPQRAIKTVEQVYGVDRTLFGIPKDFSPETKIPDEFKDLYRAAHSYIIDVYNKIPAESQFGLYKIFGYTTIGASPQDDILNSLDKGRDLDRHATLIVLANILKRVERHSERGIEAAADVLKKMVKETPYWYGSSWGLSGWDWGLLEWVGIEKERPYIADPRALMQALKDPNVVVPDKENVINSLNGDVFSKHLVEAALNFSSQDTEEKAQTR